MNEFSSQRFEPQSPEFIGYPSSEALVKDALRILEETDGLDTGIFGIEENKVLSEIATEIMQRKAFIESPYDHNWGGEIAGEWLNKG